MKNFRIDVILDEERRSASTVGVKAIVRIASLSVGSLLLAGAAAFGWDVISLKSEADGLRREWESIKGVVDMSAKVSAEKKRNEEIFSEFEGWRKSRMLWHKHLADLQRVVPTRTMSLTKYEVVGRLGVSRKKTTELTFSSVFEGIVRDPSPKRALERFTVILKKAVGFKDKVASAEVVYSKKHPKGGNYRSFQIQASYRPRTFN